MCGPRRKRKRKRSKTFGEKYLARGAEDEQRRKMKKIWRRKIDGDTDNQNQQLTNWVNNRARLNNQRQRIAIPIESNSHLRVNGRGQRTNIIKLPNAWKIILS